MAGILNPVIGSPAGLTAAVAIMSNDIDMNGNRVVGMAEPLASDDAARKVDTEGITIPVINASGGTVNVPLSK